MSCLALLLLRTPGWRQFHAGLEPRIAPSRAPFPPVNMLSLSRRTAAPRVRPCGGTTITAICICSTYGSAETEARARIPACSQRAAHPDPHPPVLSIWQLLPVSHPRSHHRLRIRLWDLPHSHDLQWSLSFRNTGGSYDETGDFDSAFCSAVLMVMAGAALGQTYSSYVTGTQIHATANHWGNSPSHHLIDTVTIAVPVAVSRASLDPFRHVRR